MARPVLSLRLKPKPAAPPGGEDVPDGVPAGAIEELVADAIGRRSCVQGRYNGGQVLLQPCLLFREHDAAFLVAVTALRDGKPPREAKLGTFRLSGLADLAATETRFTPADLHFEWTDKEGREIVTRLRR